VRPRDGQARLLIRFAGDGRRHKRRAELLEDWARRGDVTLIGGVGSWREYFMRMPVPDKFIAIGVNGRAPALIYEYNVVPCRQNRRIQEAGQGPPTPTPETHRCKNVKIKIKKR